MQKIKEKIYRLLRWSEKYTKTDMVYLTHGGFWINLWQIISSASAFFLAIAFANLLPKETFGVYKYILSVCGILAIPTLSGINTAVIQAVARGYEGSLIPGLKTKIRWGLFGGLASLILAIYYYFQGNSTLSVCFLISSVFLPIMDSFAIYDSLLQGKKLFSISSRYGIISQIIAGIIMIATLFLTKNIFIIVLAYFLPWTAVRFVFLKITLKKFQPNQNEDSKTISYGKHLSLIGVLNTIASYLDRLLVFQLLGAVELAVYSIAIAFPENIRNFLKFIQPLALPKFANQNKKEIKQYIFKKMEKLAILLIVIILLYILTAPLIFKILMPKYQESIFYSQIFSFSLIYFVIALPVSALQAQMEQKKLYQFYTTTSIFQILILLPAAYFFGIMGIVIARLISRIFQVIFIIFIIKKI